MTSCRVWRTEKRPATVTDDHSSVEIGVSGKSAQPTPERGLIRSVLLIHMPTLRTFSGRVPRIHQDQRNAGDIRLVADERSKLPERPRGKRSSLLFAGNPDPATNASKFFDGDRRFRAFSLGNELLGNAVVYVASESRFLPAHSFQPAFRGARAFALELRAQTTAPISDAAKGCAGAAPAVGVG